MCPVRASPCAPPSRAKHCTCWRRGEPMTAAALPGSIARDGILRRLSDLMVTRRGLLVLVLLIPPMLWLGIVYLGALFALLAQSFFSIDEFSGTIVHEPTLKSYRELAQPANLDIIVRTLTVSAIVTALSAIIAFPIAYFAARYARGRT